MTRIKILQDARAEWVEKSTTAKETISEIYAREQNAVKDALLPFFIGFSPDAYIDVQRGSVYFKMFDPQRGYNKDIFSLYLKEDWSGDKSFKAVDLSYYTTSTSGVDEWELKRLRMLGDLAEIVLKKQGEIVDAANKALSSFKEEYEVAFQLQNMISTAISDIDVRIRQLTKERVEFDLKNDRVEFTEGRNIDLKYNYSPRVISIKLIDLSKSGKKATVVFQFAHGGSISREENCSVEKIVDQVAFYYPNYAKDTKEELLPS
jgi:hypothetical protein